MVDTQQLVVYMYIYIYTRMYTFTIISRSIYKLTYYIVIVAR